MPKSESVMILWHHGAGLRCVVNRRPGTRARQQSRLELCLQSSCQVLRRKFFVDFRALLQEADRWHLDYLGCSMPLASAFAAT
jgi:hypothetical protein